MQPTSWDAAYTERYGEWSPHVTADIPFYVGLAREAGEAAIVELAVGNGRVAIPVAEAAGRMVIGIDRSPVMRAQARAAAAGAGVDLELEALYGGFEHEPFTAESREYVFAARQPSGSAS